MEIHEKSDITSAFFLNLTFTVLELIGAIFTNSVAILANVSHDIGDNVTLALTWYLEKISAKGRTDAFSYGYKRFSLLGAFINSIILIVSSIFITIEAVRSLLHPSTVHAQGMILLSMVGLIFNGLAYLRLKKGKTQNEKLIKLHFIQDILSWVVVLAVSLLIFVDHFELLDPLLSLGIIGFILLNVFKNLKQIIMLFLQAVPEEFNITSLETQFKMIPSITGIHDTHIWSLNGRDHVLTSHIIMEKGISYDEIVNTKCKLKEIISHQKIHHSTIEFELEGEKCNLGDC